MHADLSIAQIEFAKSFNVDKAFVKEEWSIVVVSFVYAIPQVEYFCRILNICCKLKFPHMLRKGWSQNSEKSQQTKLKEVRQWFKNLQIHQHQEFWDILEYQYIRIFIIIILYSFCEQLLRVLFWGIQSYKQFVQFQQNYFQQMPTCSTHNQEASYICLYTECKFKVAKYYLCDQCLYQYHEDHLNYCIIIQDLVNDSQSVKCELNKSIELIELRLAQLSKMKMSLIQKLDKIMEIDQILMSLKESQKILPPQISKLDNYAQRLVSFNPPQNQIKNLKIECQKLATNTLQCSCPAEKPIGFLNIEENVPLGKRTMCVECQHQQQTKTSIEMLEDTVKEAEQQEMYIKEIVKIKKEKTELQTALNQTLNSLELLINYQSMFFNEALTQKNKSIKIILEEKQSRQQYQKIAEFLSSFVQYKKDSQEFNSYFLMELYEQIYIIKMKLIQINTQLQSQKVLKEGNNYTVICEIFKFNQLIDTKIIVIRRDATVEIFLLLLKNTSGIGIKIINNKNVKGLFQDPIINYIQDKGNYGKLKLQI